MKKPATGSRETQAATVTEKKKRNEGHVLTLSVFIMILQVSTRGRTVAAPLVNVSAFSSAARRRGLFLSGQDDICG